MSAWHWRPLGVALVLGYVGWCALETRAVLRTGLDALAGFGLRPGQDPSSVAKRRYAALAPWLPHSGVVGYWCSATGAAGVLDPRSNAALGGRWIDAQLALAPLRLFVSLEARYVLADFDGATPAPPQGSGLVLRHEQAPGLAVFERASGTGR